MQAHELCPRAAPVDSWYGTLRAMMAWLLWCQRHLGLNLKVRFSCAGLGPEGPGAPGGAARGARGAPAAGPTGGLAGLCEPGGRAVAGARGPGAARRDRAEPADAAGRCARACWVYRVSLSPAGKAWRASACQACGMVTHVPLQGLLTMVRLPVRFACGSALMWQPARKEMIAAMLWKVSV